MNQFISQVFRREKRKRNKRNEVNTCSVAWSCQLICSLLLAQKFVWLGIVGVTLHKTQLLNMKFPLTIGQLLDKCYWYLVNAVGNMAIECHYFSPVQSTMLRVQYEKYCTLIRPPRCRYFYGLVISYYLWKLTRRPLLVNAQTPEKKNISMAKARNRILWFAKHSHYFDFWYLSFPICMCHSLANQIWWQIYHLLTNSLSSNIIPCKRKKRVPMKNFEVLKTKL